MNQVWNDLCALPIPFWCLFFALLGSLFTGTDENLKMSGLSRFRAIFFGTFFSLATVWILCELFPFFGFLSKIQVPLNGYFGAMGFNIGSGARNYSDAYKTDFLKFLKDLLLLKQTIQNEKIDLPNSGDRPA